MSLQEQLNALYDEGRETLAYHEQMLTNNHRALPEYLTYLAERMSLTPERILTCAQMLTTEKYDVYDVIFTLYLFYQNDAILTDKHKGDTPS